MPAGIISLASGIINCNKVIVSGGFTGQKQAVEGSSGPIMLR